MMISGLALQAYEYVPPAPVVIKSVVAMAVTAVALEAMCYVPGASAGPVTYAACVLGCSFATTAAAPACFALCAVSIGPWCA